MGRPKSTGGSHNKNASTYKSKRVTSKTALNRQRTIFEILKKNNEESDANDIQTETCDNEDGDVKDDEQMEHYDDDDNDKNSNEEKEMQDERKRPRDGRTFLTVMQTHEHWEIEYPFAYYSAKEKGWLCKICTEYGNGEYWRSKAVSLWEHPNRTFLKHQESPKHIEAVRKRQECKKMLKKGNIYQQVVQGQRIQKASIKDRNRRVLKKFLSTIYFFVKKHWAVRENFEDIVNFLRDDIGDADIDAHLRDCSSRATYVSVTSVDEFLKCIDQKLDKETCVKIIAAGEYSLLADETTDIADRAVMAIFIRYVDSDSHKVVEQYLGLVEIIGSKGAEALCKKICEVLNDKGIAITQLHFHGFDGTNTMSGERSGLQRRIRHEAPHSKYVNCRNHRLALVFVHLLPKYQSLSEVDANILAVWKIMKYSSVRAAIYGEAQNVEGLQNKKLLKAAPTRWLSHGEACARVISRFDPLITSLDEIIRRDNDTEIRGTRDQLLEPDNIMMLLLLADILNHVNKFSKFLQTRNLIFANVNTKLIKLKAALKRIEENDGPLFNAHAVSFLKLAREKMKLARRLRNTCVIPEDELLDELISNFKTNIKAPFMKNLTDELDNALRINDKIFLAFDVFNVLMETTKEDRDKKIQTLVKFYGSSQISKFQQLENTGSSLFKFQGDIFESSQAFFEDFETAKLKLEKKRNETILDLLKNGKLLQNDIDKYKDDHPIQPNNVYAIMVNDREQYPEIMKLFKLSLLIPPSTANVERGFSVLKLVHTKQRNRLSIKSIDRLLRIILVGKEKLSEEEYDSLIDTYANMSNRRIEL